MNPQQAQSIDPTFAVPGFILERTSDGSPTLRLAINQTATDHIRGESMHHSGGAATETQYIYGIPLKQAARYSDHKLNVVIIGLGLGYIEILAALQTFNQINHPGFSMTSYESVPQLVTNFKDWFFNLENSNPTIYDQVAQSLDAEGDLLKLRHTLKKMSLNNDLDLRAELNIDENFVKKYHVICFDAFSQKTSSPLWQKDFLEQFIEKACAQDCIFTTYACTGVLRRALLECGFEVIKRPGFFGKRDSTLALRGRFKKIQSLFQNGEYNP